MQYVIVGAGPAGVVAAETLRKTDPDGDVTLLGGEPGAPYARMAIPYYLSGDIEETGTRVRHQEGHYEDLGIRYVNGRVKGVSAAKSRLDLESGESLDYDRLLVATGSTPTLPPAPGFDRPAVHHCWTLEDARNIISLAKSGAHVVMLGVGFVACIIMQALVKRGVQLTVIAGPSGRMVRSMFDLTAGGMIRNWLESKGVRVVVGTRVAEVKDGPAVALESGETIDADLVVVATGVKANTGFLDGSGVSVNEGVIVDEFLRSTVPNIYAAGDVAEGIDFSTRSRAVHAIQPTAVEHGRMAALNMAGVEVPFKGSISMNVLASVGLISSSFANWNGVEGGDSSTMVDEDRFRYMRLEFQEDRLIGGIAVGVTQNIGVLRGLIQTEVRLGAWKKKLMEDPHQIMEAYVACTCT